SFTWKVWLMEVFRGFLFLSGPADDMNCCHARQGYILARPVEGTSMKTITRRCSVLAFSLAAFALAGCGGDASDPSDTASQQAAPPAQQATTSNTTLHNTNAADCTGEQGIEYLCGLVNAEDILRVSTPWLLVSGMNGELTGDASLSGRIHLVNPEDRSWEVLFPGDAPVLEHDTEMFASCPGPLDVNNFSAHGLALKAVGGQAEPYWQIG